MADMTGATGGLDARVSELEARIREMERREHEAGPMRSILRELFPAEAREHLRAARREQLLAMRSFLDHWIDKVEEKDAGSSTRERITLE